MWPLENLASPFGIFQNLTTYYGMGQQNFDMQNYWLLNDEEKLIITKHREHKYWVERAIRQEELVWHPTLT